MLIMSFIARTLKVVASGMHGPRQAEMRFKNVVLTPVSETAIARRRSAERDNQALCRDPQGGCTSRVL